jgi:DNA-binding NarL/FixJ family response regulator
MAIRVIAVEDHPLMLKAILAELSRDPEIQVVGELAHSAELAKLVYDKRPDVLVLDLALSGEAFDPLTTVRNLTLANPNLGILILTGFDDPLLMRSLIEAGALGYILKSDDLSMQLCRAVKTVYGGQPFYSDQVVHKIMTVAKPDLLTDQELATLRLVATGITTNEVAAAMKLSEKRIRNILTSIYAKLDVRGERKGNQRVAAANKARELGLLIEP